MEEDNFINSTPGKKYTAIVKISNNPDGKEHSLRYYFNNLLKFTSFLDMRCNGWKGFKIYSNKDKNKVIQIGSFTNSNVVR
jgi:hypothetical protein